MKALKDFSHMGIEVKAGEEVSNDLFEPDVYPMLVQKGLVGDDVPDPKPVAEGNVIPAPAKEKVVAKRQRKESKK